MTGMEEITGQTTNISDWLDFEFYDTVLVLNRTSMKMDTVDDKSLPAKSANATCSSFPWSFRYLPIN